MHAMNTCRLRALDLFDAYAEMPDEQQSQALADLRRTDPGLHDALVQLLVADALGHSLDVPPWALRGSGESPSLP